ncbi:hypothetical protein FQA39_LY15631 [Lamprigera yunnana]|nr:hypothetical protein FQA39_LY15631 [Lamprigera yunnana]
MWFTFTAIVTIFVLILYYQIIKSIYYWKNRNVANKGSLATLRLLCSIIFQRKSYFDHVRELYNEFKNQRYFGILQFNTPALYIRDLDLIKRITVTDFNHFADHPQFAPDNVEPLTEKNIFNLKGQNWRDMRSILTPTFTSNKMKIMFTLVLDCAQDFMNYIEKQKQHVVELEVKDVFSRYTNDVIASVVFGLKCNSLEERTNEFYAMGRKLSTINGIKVLLITIYNLFEFFPSTVTSFFTQIIKEAIIQREQGVVRPDLIQLLVETRKKSDLLEYETTVNEGFATTGEHKYQHAYKKNNLKLTDDDIIAQAIIFLFGGFETTSTLMSFLAYELAINLNVQQMLQSEIDKTLRNCNGPLTYEALSKMKYMDMVISETLRKWPLGFQIDRTCTKEYTIHPLYPWEKRLVVEKGTLVIIPIVGLHRDPKYYPNPKKFDPERFNDVRKHTIKPSSYMPFGAGPRNCIASRFVFMTTKIIIFHLLSKYDLLVIDKTPIPLNIAAGTFTALNLGPAEGFWLGLKQRN